MSGLLKLLWAWFLLSATYVLSTWIVVKLVNKVVKNV